MFEISSKASTRAIIERAHQDRAEYLAALLGRLFRRRAQVGKPAQA
jgi:hypothetical protein